MRITPRIWLIVRTLAIVAGVVLVTRAIASAGDDSAQWLLVASDSSYTISIDTTKITPDYRAYDIWYRTDHRAMRFYEQKEFNRETVHALLRCDTYSYRISSIALSIGSARPVVRQSMTPEELNHQKWRQVEAGSTEADAARATCEAAKRYVKRHR